jgi:integrase
MSRRDSGDGNVWFDKARGVYRGKIVLPHDPKPHYFTGRLKRDVTDAIDALKKTKAPTGYTVRAAAEEWMRDHVTGTCRETTRTQYEVMLRVHILPVIGDKLVEDVLPKDVQSIINGMTRHLQPNSKRKVTPLRPRTLRHAKITLHALYAWLVINRKVERNPVVGIKLPEVGDTTRRSLDVEDIPELFATLERSRWLRSVQFLLMTGLRRGELLALKWSDIETDKQGHEWVHVSRTLARSGTEGPPKSRAGNRSIRIGRAVRAILDAQRDMLEMDGLTPWTPDPDVEDDAPIHGETAHVFPSETGAAMNPNTYYHTIINLSKKSGHRISVHELRHTFVSISGRGMDLKALQSVLGHTSSTLTLDIYRHILDGDMERASNVVDSAAVSIGLLPKPSTPASTPYEKERVSEIRKPAP